MSLDQSAAVPALAIPDILADRARNTSASVANIASENTQRLIKAGRDIVNLTIGEPDFDTPENILEAANKAMYSGKTHYTASDGALELKEAIIAKFARENALHFSAEEIIVSSGSKQAVFNCFMATVEKGDEVIIPAPFWPSYGEMARMVGGDVVNIACGQDAGFKLSPEQLEEAITPRTKWLVLNSPSNPSGAVYSETELRDIGAVLARHPRVHLLSDDIYEHITYGNTRNRAAPHILPELKDRIVIINGVSKAFSMTGWRIGYAAGPVPILRAMARIQSQATSCPSSIGQYAAIEALEASHEAAMKFRDIFHARMRFIIGELNKIPGLSCLTPGGAFYAFPSYAALIGKKAPSGRIIRGDADMIDHLLDHGVAGVAGAAYGLEGHVRLSFASDEASLARACSRIRQACAVLA